MTLLDLGVSTAVALSDIHPISKEMVAEKIRVFPARLGDLKPAGGAVWSLRAKELFTELVTENADNLYMQKTVRVCIQKIILLRDCLVSVR